MILKLVLALSICALPSSGHWGIGSLSPTSNGPALHRGTAHPCAFSGNIGDPPRRQGFLVTPLLCPMEWEWWYPGDTAGCQQGWLQKPADLHLHRAIPVCAAPCRVVAQPQVIVWFSRRYRVLGVSEAVTCSSPSSPFAFPTPYKEKPGAVGRSVF